jgi:hypothetical protein
MVPATGWLVVVSHSQQLAILRTPSSVSSADQTRRAPRGVRVLSGHIVTGSSHSVAAAGIGRVCREESGG